MVSDPERWAKTDAEIALLNEARRRCDLCAACGRALDVGETVYLERFNVGPRLTGHGFRRSQQRAPVGAECATTELLDHVEDPERCAGCGRGVVCRPDRGPRRQRALCSLRCAGRARNGRQPKKMEGRRSMTKGWGARLQRLREALGLSRAELALALRRAGIVAHVVDIRRWEHGSSGPRIEKFGALARALGVSMEELLYGEAEAERIARERAHESERVPAEPAEARD